MREGVGAHDRLVGLHLHAGDAAHQPAGAGDLGAHDASLIGHHVLPHLQRHGDFFHRGIPGALADAVHRGFHLSRPGHYRAQRVGHGQAQIIVAMGGEDRLIGIGHAGDHIAEHGAIGGGRRIAHRVGQVDRRRPGVDRGFHRPAQEIRIRPRRILGRPFDIAAQVAGMADRKTDRFQHLFRRLVQLHLHVQRRGGDEGVDARVACALQRRPGPFDIGRGGAGQAGDDGGVAHVGDGLHGFEITFAGDGETGFDDVHAQRFQLRCDFQFFLEIHRAAGGLFPVAQGGVEDADTIIGHGSACLNAVI